MFSKRVNRCQGDGFSSVGARTAPYGWYLGLVWPISSIVGLLILYTVHTSYNLNATRAAHARATRVIHAYF